MVSINKYLDPSQLREFHHNMCLCKEEKSEFFSFRTSSRRLLTRTDKLGRFTGRTFGPPMDFLSFHFHSLRFLHMPSKRNSEVNNKNSYEKMS